MAGARRSWQPRRVERRPTLSLNEWAVLGLLVEQPRHGYDIAAELRPGSPIGAPGGSAASSSTGPSSGSRPWAWPSPAAPNRRGGPPARSTGRPAGAAPRCGSGSTTPVEHLRDVRSALLLKLVLLQRLGLDRTELVRAQQTKFAPLLDELDQRPERRRRNPLAPALCSRGSNLPLRHLGTGCARRRWRGGPPVLTCH